MAEETRIVSLALKKIILDPRTQPREQMDQTMILDLAEVVRAQRQPGCREPPLPPIVVFKTGQDYFLGDGWHRYRAHEEEGEKYITAEVRPGTLRDAILYSCGVNARHGLRRKNEDIRRAVRTLLRDPEWSKWSNAEIARRCAVDEGTVRNHRAILKEEQSGNKISSENPIPPARRLVERNGVIYEMADPRPEKVCPLCHGLGRVRE